MKICFVVEHFSPHIGGVEIAFEEYAKRLATKGHEIRVITSNSGGITGVRTDQNIRIFHLECRSFFGHPILSARQIDTHVQWSDIVHTTTFTAAIPALKAARKHKKPCIIMVHEVLGSKWFRIEKNPVLALAFLLFERYVLGKKYDRWQTVSDATTQDLLNLGVPTGKIRMIHHGIDYTLWNPDVKKKDLHHLLELDSQKKIFLYNGRLGKTKGVQLLLEAIKRTWTILPDNFIFGFIISKNPIQERRNFERSVANLGLTEKIRIHDSLPYNDLPGYRKAAFACIAPSLTEGFGFNAAEISALNTPLIVSDAGSLPEVATGKVLFFHAGNSLDLSEKIMLATQGRFKNIPERKFDWNLSTEKLISLYRELI